MQDVAGAWVALARQYFHVSGLHRNDLLFASHSIERYRLTELHRLPSTRVSGNRSYSLEGLMVADTANQIDRLWASP